VLALNGEDDPERQRSVMRSFAVEAKHLSALPAAEIKGLTAIVYAYAKRSNDALSGELATPDELAIPENARRDHEQPNVSQSPPLLGELLVCLFVPADRQEEQLGDLEEKFRKLWLPKFGRRAAPIVYIVNAILDRAVMISIGLVAAAIDRLLGVFR
jgi:hypothetical protein